MGLQFALTPLVTNEKDQLYDIYQKFNYSLICISYFTGQALVRWHEYLCMILFSINIFWDVTSILSWLSLRKLPA